MREPQPTRPRTLERLHEVRRQVDAARRVGLAVGEVDERAVELQLPQFDAQGLAHPFAGVGEVVASSPNSDSIS